MDPAEIKEEARRIYDAYNTYFLTMPKLTPPMPVEFIVMLNYDQWWPIFENECNKSGFELTVRHYGGDPFEAILSDFEPGGSWSPRNVGRLEAKAIYQEIKNLIEAEKAVFLRRVMNYRATRAMVNLRRLWFQSPQTQSLSSVHKLS